MESLWPKFDANQNNTQGERHGWEILLFIDLFGGKILENQSFAGHENVGIESPILY